MMKLFLFDCQTFLRHFGDYVAGNKKLFHYMGETEYIMKVPSKPVRIGLSIYQWVCELVNGLPFMIHFRMMASLSSRTEWTPVDEAVVTWIRVVNKFPHKPALVVFDTYYFSTETSVLWLIKTKFIGAMRKDRLPVTEAMVGRVNCLEEK